MSVRSGRVIVGLSVSPRSQSIENYVPQGPQIGQYYETSLTGSHENIPMTYLSSSCHPSQCSEACSPNNMPRSYHSPQYPNSNRICNLCENMDEWSVPCEVIHEEESTLTSGNKSEWCNYCGKQDVGPPCKCTISGFSGGGGFNIEGEDWNPGSMTQIQGYYSNQSNAHHLPRSSSDCALNRLHSVEERLGIAFGHCREPCFPETIVNSRSILAKRSAGGVRIREGCSKTYFPPPKCTRSLENLPRDIKEHILRCQCTCDHLGYGNFSATSLHHLTPPLNNEISPISSKLSSQTEIPRELPLPHKQRELDIRGHIWGVVCLVLVLAGVAGVGVSVPLALKNVSDPEFQERLRAATTLLTETPLVDGHNDLPWNIRKFMHNKLHSFNMTADLSNLRPWSRSAWSHTDLPRLRRGHVGAQFWVSYVPCESQFLNAVQLTIEQIDLIKRLIDQYPEDLQLATSAEDVEASFREGRIASLIGVEGGHAIQNSLGVLRALYDLGVRYMTLTHTCSTPWAESARNKESDEEDPNSPRGLTHFGRTVVREMNRLGLLVDLSHVSQATMRAALQVSKSPVLFSHSSVYAICKNPRNVPDDILRQIAMNGGLVMVSFYNHFLTCNQEATIKDVVKHINHVRAIAGVDHVGIGADFDGVDKLPSGLEDVSKYPNLFAELMKDSRWNEEDLKKLAGLNLLRVLRDVEKVRKELRLRRARPNEEEVPPSQLLGKQNCSYNFVEANPS